MGERTYYHSIDLARILLMACLIFVTYGDYVPYASWGIVALNFAPGAFFALYGYLVLTPDNDLKKNVLRSLKVFLIMAVVFFAIDVLYYWLLYGQPLAFVTGRTVFNFLVLNVWAPNIGTHIWLVQACLYALVILWGLQKAKLLDKIALPLCIVLFIVNFLVSEGAGLINFNIDGYTYIPGNFFTRALPYMLLGKVFRKYRNNFLKLDGVQLFTIFIVGVVLCYVELFGLNAIGKLVYINHFLGYILMVFALLVWVCSDEYRGNFMEDYAPKAIKISYFLYNPVTELLLLFVALFNKSALLYYVLIIMLPFVVMLLVMLIPILCIVLKNWFKNMERM